MVAWSGAPLRQSAGQGSSSSQQWRMTACGCRARSSVRGRGSGCMAREPLCSPALPALWGATPVGCSGFSSWAGGCSHDTRVTAESQRFGFLKHETRQTRQYSFPLCSWSGLAAPAEPLQCPPGSGWGRRRAPAWEAETGNSYSTAQRSLDICSSLAFF